MAARWEWGGMAELQANLGTLAADLTADATALVRAAAVSAETTIEMRYPVRRTGLLSTHGNRGSKRPFYPPGGLRRGVWSKVWPGGGRFVVRYQVKSSAAHAHLYERGTKARRTKRGAKRGSMPKANVMVPVMQSARRVLEGEMRALMTSHGLTVTG